MKFDNVCFSLCCCYVCYVLNKSYLLAVDPTSWFACLILFVCFSKPLFAGELCSSHPIQLENRSTDADGDGLPTTLGAPHVLELGPPTSRRAAAGCTLKVAC